MGSGTIATFISSISTFTTLIFGQKEALEGTVIVRNMLTRSQETIKITKLADYIKAIK